jgi:predicted lipoprotein with Yx(FWY)xxD motif
MLRMLLRLAGAGLLAATAAIHLDLYLTGYRSIPTIGWLFLLQVIAAFALAAAVLATAFARGDGLVPRLVAAAGAGFAVATLGGYLLSLWTGLFGFKEVRTTAGTVAGVIEVAAFAVLAVVAVAPAPGAARVGSAAGAGHAAGADAAGRHAGGARPGHGLAGMRAALVAAGALSLIALAVLGGSVAAATSAPAAGPASASGTPAVLKTATIGGVSVLTNAKGLTLYWFAPDTSARSACYGSCAAYWPPVTGAPVAGPGVTGRTGTISRTGGGTQVTYDGHPLYTYIGDTAPGQASGNNLDLNGGYWYEMTAAG